MPRSIRQSVRLFQARTYDVVLVSRIKLAYELSPGIRQRARGIQGSLIGLAYGSHLITPYLTELNEYGCL